MNADIEQPLNDGKAGPIDINRNRNGSTESGRLDSMGGSKRSPKSPLNPSLSFRQATYLNMHQPIDTDSEDDSEDGGGLFIEEDQSTAEPVPSPKLLSMFEPISLEEQKKITSRTKLFSSDKGSAPFSLYTSESEHFGVDDSGSGRPSMLEPLPPGTTQEDDVCQVGGLGGGGGGGSLLVDAVAGFASFFIVGVMCISMASSTFAALPALQDHLGSGINMAALGVFVSGVYLAIFSKVPYMIGSPDLFLCPFFSLMAEQMKIIDNEESQRATFFATIIVATALTGISLILAAKYKLLRFSEFIPYPVVCGLLAGIGVLLIEMGIKLAFVTLDLAGLLCFLPGLLFGAVDSLLKLRGVPPPRGLLPLTVAMVLAFYGVAAALGVDRGTLEDNNFVFRSDVVADAHFTALWPAATEAGLIRWGALAACWQTALVMILLVVLKASLMWPGCEKLFEVELDHAGELATLGWANLIGGAAGSFGATPILATMVMVQQMGGGRLRPVAVHLALMAAFYFMSFEVVAFIPKFVFVGLLLSQGYALVHSWAVLPFARIPRLEWSIIVLINGFFLLIGMLPAVAIGAGVSVVIFAYHFHVVGCLRSEGTGLTVRSGINRSEEEYRFLDHHGDSIRVLELQGYMFFGNASKLFARVRGMLGGGGGGAGSRRGSEASGGSSGGGGGGGGGVAPAGAGVGGGVATDEGSAAAATPRFLVLDLPLMLGVDASAVDTFVRITKLAKDCRCKLLISGANKIIKRYLTKNSASPLVTSKWVQFHADLDEALGAAEDALLWPVVRRHRAQEGALRGLGVTARFRHTLGRAGITYNFEAAGLEGLAEHVTSRDLAAGELLFNQLRGTKVDLKKEGLYFIEHGFISVKREAPEHNLTVNSKIEFLKNNRGLARQQARSFRLTRLGPGCVIGSLELCSGLRTLGTYRAETPCRVYYLPFRKVVELEASDPTIVLLLYKAMARMISRGYDRTKETLAHLSDTIYGGSSGSAPGEISRTMSGFNLDSSYG